MRYLLLLSLLLLLPACLMPKAVAPMPVDLFNSSTNGDQMVIMFPGYGDRAGTFREYDFFETLLKNEPAFADTLFVATDAHIGYYRSRSLPKRIEEDVLARFPQRQKLTLLGVSMGGMGASIIASMHSEQVERLILFAPYLGGKRFLKRIAADQLQPTPDDSLRERGLLKAWRFLIEDAATTGAEITVLYGESDRLAAGIELLAEKAPHVKLISREGGHGWATWTPLWQTYLQQQTTSSP